MPKVTIDLLNIDLVKDSLTIFKDLLNDERLPEELYLEYGSRFDKLWNVKMKTEVCKICKKN
jgi:hypothetical protein